MKKILIFALIPLLFCIAQAVTTDYSLNPGNFGSVSCHNCSSNQTDIYNYYCQKPPQETLNLSLIPGSSNVGNTSYCKWDAYCAASNTTDVVCSVTQTINAGSKFLLNSGGCNLNIDCEAGKIEIANTSYYIPIEAISTDGITMTIRIGDEVSPPYKIGQPTGFTYKYSQEFQCPIQKEECPETIDINKISDVDKAWIDTFGNQMQSIVNDVNAGKNESVSRCLADARYYEDKYHEANTFNYVALIMLFILIPLVVILIFAILRLKGVPLRGFSD